MLLLTQPCGGSLSSPLRICNQTPSRFSNPRPNFSFRNLRKHLKLTVSNASEGVEDASTSSTNQAVSTSFISEEPVFVDEKDIPLEGVIQFDKPSSSFPLDKYGRVALLAGGDVVFLLLFSAIGRFRHGLPVVDLGTLHTADPFIAGWFLSAYFLGGYGDDGRGMNGFTKSLIASTKSWAAGIPLGILIRAATSGHIPQSTFMLVTMGSTGALMVGWRALFYSLLPGDKIKKNDVYKRGNPFELFELLSSLVRRW